MKPKRTTVHWVVQITQELLEGGDFSGWKNETWLRRRLRATSPGTIAL